VTRAMVTALGAVAGFIEGMVFFVIVNFSLDAPFDIIVSGAWLDDLALIFGGVAAIGGAIVGWGAYAWTSEARVYRSVPRRPAKAGDPPYQGPIG
jgi:hypothetical protein